MSYSASSARFQTPSSTNTLIPSIPADSPVGLNVNVLLASIFGGCLLLIVMAILVFYRQRLFRMRKNKFQTTTSHGDLMVENTKYTTGSGSTGVGSTLGDITQNTMLSHTAIELNNVNKSPKPAGIKATASVDQHLQENAKDVDDWMSVMTGYETAYSTIRQTQKNDRLNGTLGIKMDPKRGTILTMLTQVNSIAPMSLPGYLLISWNTDLKMMGELASGGFSTIYKAAPLSDELQERSLGQPVAVKKLKDQPSDDPDDVQDSFAQEVALMADVAQLPDFVKIIGFSLNPKAIVMPIYSLGDFDDLIHNNGKAISISNANWTPDFLCDLFSDLAAALAYLHSKEISHSDVKPGNAMLERRADRLHLLLTDFSFSTIKGPAKSGVKGFRFSEAVGLSIPYASPEMLLCMQGRINAGIIYLLPTHCRDSYSFGISLIEAMLRKDPWGDIENDVLMPLVIGGKRPNLEKFLQKSSADKRWSLLIQLATDCWQQLPNKRIKMSDALHRLRQISQTR